jgi:4-amino-4-deoxy-L-arabinose transferase-like glycosyltransferase
MVALIYLHMRRFRPGGHLDAALITVACAGIIGFARGASTDMQMAAPLAIGLLGWYAWYETGSKFWLFDIYFFTGVATLAKGPVAPFLAIAHHGRICLSAPRVVAFCGARSGGRAWCSTSPWCCPGSSPCSIRIPTFFREFFLEHNLERFATDRYQHSAAVLVLPGGGAAGHDALDGDRGARAHRRHPDLGGGVAAAPFNRACKPCAGRPGDAFPEFLVLWALIPIVFFSFSQSKLPGYILPSIPPITILTGDYLFRRRQPGLNRWVLLGHAALCGVMTMFALLLPWFVAHGARCRPRARAGRGAGWPPAARRC